MGDELYFQRILIPYLKYIRYFDVDCVLEEICKGIMPL